MRLLRVRYRKSAAADLAQLYFYLRHSGASQQTAFGYVGRIRAVCRAIGDAPDGGRPRDDLRPGLRTWAFERRALITYRVDSQGVQIVNIFSRGRDVEAYYRQQRDISDE